MFISTVFNWPTDAQAIPISSFYVAVVVLPFIAGFQGVI